MCLINSPNSTIIYGIFYSVCMYVCMYLKIYYFCFSVLFFKNHNNFPVKHYLVVLGRLHALNGMIAMPEVQP